MDPESTRPSEKTRLLKAEERQEAGDWGATIKLIVISGSGLFADGWDLSINSFLVASLVHLYPQSVTLAKESMVASATYIGVIIGQFAFGFIADILGRKWSSVATATLTIAGVVASGCVNDGGYFTIATCMAVCRFFAGIGIGGEYPISAAIAKEMGHNLAISRLQLLQVNASMLNLGSVVQSLFCFILLSAGVGVGSTWRIAVICGAGPSVVAFGLRTCLEEEEAPHPRGRRLSSYYDSSKSLFGRLFPVLVVCSVTWLKFGFSGHGLMISAPQVSVMLFGSEEEGIVVMLKRLAIFNTVLGVLRTLGNILSCCLVQRGVSITRVQWAGLVAMAASVWLSALFQKISWLAALFFFLCSMTDGVVGITMYVAPSIYFPKSVRATAVGLASSFGKVGAVLGTALFPIMEHDMDLRWAMFIAGAVALSTALVSMMTPTAEVH